MQGHRQGRGQGQAKEEYADKSAGMWLMWAAGVGAVYSLFLELSGNAGFNPPWDPLDLTWFPLWPFNRVLVPAGLLLAAYAMTARVETKLDIRRQRGALAILFFLSLLLPLGGVFAVTYGISLLALSVRTRDTLTAVTGAMALVASVAVPALSASVPPADTADFFSRLLTDLASPCVLGLMAAALFIAASRTNPGPWPAAGGQQDTVGQQAGPERLRG
ncbi:hypothetical protein H9639_01005 [Arthrobacter sp. Sa2CUA1]|uniref:Uncharacterized protein n=1 Tax=Arthrobacter gallicola TaxID=2762225 RepID=A0ABR8UMV2_9MICC|nr:hypothetical protein [Arthrobacter gallicola]